MATKVNMAGLSRPDYNYSPTQWYWHRLSEVMYFDAMKVEYPHGPLLPRQRWSFEDARPTDDALLARAWFAWSEPEVTADGEREFCSWPEVCHWLDWNWHIETASILAKIDARADFDTPECHRRLKELAARQEEEEVLFEVPEMFRVVPVRDQLSIFEAAA